MLRKRRAFSWRRNCFPMILHIFPVRIIQWIFPKLAHMASSVSPGSRTMSFRGTWRQMQ